MKVASQLDGFHHQAIAYSGDDGYLEEMVPFLQEGLVEGAAMLVMVPPDKIDLLGAHLGADGSSVQFEDMTKVGANPARIIPAWQEFVDVNLGRPIRGVGEPVWQGRDDDELAECRIHEALINPALSDGVPWRLVCPYDRDALPPIVLQHAQETHPWFGPVSTPQVSAMYSENGYVSMDDPLPPPDTETMDLAFDIGNQHQLRRLVAEEAEEAGLGDRSDDLVLAVNEIVTNSIVHGGGRGRLRVWRTRRSLVCEVRDKGRIEDPLVGRRRPNGQITGGIGMWMVNQLCDLVQIRMLSNELVVRLHVFTD